MQKYNTWNTIKKKNNRYIHNKKIKEENSSIINRNRFDMGEENISHEIQKKDTVYDKFEKGKELLQNIVYFPDSPVDFI